MCSLRVWCQILKFVRTYGATWLRNTAELIKAQEPEKSEPRNERKAKSGKHRQPVVYVFHIISLPISFRCCWFLLSFFSLSRVFSYTLRAEISGERPTLFGTVFLRVLRMSFHGHNHRLYIVCVCVAILQIDENDRECESELQFASITGDYGINFLEATVPSNDNRIEISQFNWYYQCHNILSRTTIFQLVSWCVRPTFLHETIFILYPLFCCYFFHSVIWFRLRKLSCSFDVVGLTVCDRSICIACHLFQVIIKKGFNIDIYMKLDVMKYSSAGRVHRRRMEIRSKIVI